MTTEFLLVVKTPSPDPGTYVMEFDNLNKAKVQYSSEVDFASACWPGGEYSVRLFTVTQLLP